MDWCKLPTGTLEYTECIRHMRVTREGNVSVEDNNKTK